MTSGAFWSSLWNVLLYEEHFRQGFLKEMKENTDEETLYRRISLLLGHLPSPDQTSDCRKFLQEMGDERLLMYTLKRVQEKLKTLSLQTDPGINDIDKVDISILQLYDVHHVKNRLSVSEEVRNTAIVTFQPIHGFLEGWMSFQGPFNLGSFHGFRAFISSTLVQDLMLTLSLIIRTMDNMDQHQMLERTAFLNFHYLFWFNAYENDPNFRQPLLRGMALSIVFWILMGSDHLPTGPQTFKQIVQNRVGPNQLPNGVAHIFANILTRSLQHHKDESIMAYHEFFDIIGRMGYLNVFVDRLGMFIQQYRTTQFFNQTKEALGALIQQVFEHMPEDARWTSLVDHARMFLLAEDVVVEKISGLSGECMQKLLDRAKKNLEQSDGAESENLHDTLEFLAMDPVIEHWKDDPTLRDMIKTKMKEALNRKVPAEQILNGTIPHTSLMLKLDSWMPSSDTLGVPYTAIGQDWIQVVMQYLSSAHKPTYPVSLTDVLRVLYWVFASEDFRTFVNSLLQKILNRMKSNDERNNPINIERYREIIPDFLMSTATKREISQKWVKEIAKETILKIFDPYLVEFLRDVLRAYTQRGKRRQRWEDTVGLRRNIEAFTKNPNVPESVREMLSEIEEMIR